MSKEPHSYELSGRHFDDFKRKPSYISVFRGRVSPPFSAHKRFFKEVADSVEPAWIDRVSILASTSLTTIIEFRQCGLDPKGIVTPLPIEAPINPLPDEFVSPQQRIEWAHIFMQNLVKKLDGFDTPDSEEWLGTIVDWDTGRLRGTVNDRLEKE